MNTVTCHGPRPRIDEATVKRDHLRHLTFDSDPGRTAPATRLQDSHSYIEKIQYPSPLDRAHRVQTLVRRLGLLCKAGPPPGPKAPCGSRLLKRQLLARLHPVRTINIMYNMSNNTEMAFALGTAEFRQAVSDSKLRGLLSEHPVVTVGRYKDEASAVVLAPERYAELQEAEGRWAHVRTILPLLMAAVRAGVAIPSSTLDGYGIELDDESWQALNQLQRIMPVRIDADEEGHPITRGSVSSASYVEELDEELVVDD